LTSLELPKLIKASPISDINGMGNRKRGKVDAWVGGAIGRQELEEQVYNVVADVLTTSALSDCNSLLML
jgi:hypothetical protein